MPFVRVTVLAGGVGGSRFLLGLRTLGHDVTVIGNTGDDITMFGLRICPDLDTVMYTLGGGISAERGWGREDESFRVRDEIAEYDTEPAWFGLGDLDLATHLLRTRWLAEGQTLSEVTARLGERWQPGVRLLPATDDLIRRGADDSGEMGAFHFLLAPLRETDLRVRIREFLPVGLEFGIFYQT